MFSSIRRRFTFANVAMTLALVFAMAGGAYAAKKYVITSTKQISPKVLKALAGKPGPAGPEGKQGPAGPAGKDGANGTNGVNGKDGATGESVTAKAVPVKVATCTEQGGSEFKIGGTTTLACNGRTGFTKTLPSKESERGTYTMLYSATAGGQLGAASMSFNIPLATAPVANKATNFIGFGEGEGEAKENKAAISSHCKGTVKEPEAMPGNLCVFVRVLANATPGAIALGSVFVDPQNGQTEKEAGQDGAGISFESVAAGPVFATGTWVVTAE